MGLNEMPETAGPFVASRIPTFAPAAAPLPPIEPQESATLDSLQWTPANVDAFATAQEDAWVDTPERALEREGHRQRVESCLLVREQTIASLTSWLHALYRVQQKVGSGYGGSGGILRSWDVVSSSTREDHLIKLALLLAGLRLQTCELVEAIAEWRTVSTLRMAKSHTRP